MREESTHVRVSRRYELRFWADDGAVHVIVAAGFEHEAFSDVVVLGHGLVALLEESSLKCWETRVDDSGWFPGCVHVDAFYGLGCWVG